MSPADAIPVFSLFGETGAFPDVVHCERIRDRAQGHGWVISPHRHSQMTQLLLLEEGRAVTRLDNAQFELEPGEMLYLPVQTVHGFDFAPGTEGQVISFPLPAHPSLHAGASDIATALAAPIRAMASPRITALGYMLTEQFEGAGLFRAQVALGLAHALLAALAEVGQASTANETAPARRMNLLDALIAEHMADGWRAADYASALSITPGQLSRICRTARGMGAQSYIEAALMTEACRMLAFTRIPIAEVGHRLGFTDPSHFARRFRLRQGETPTDYRNRFSG